MELIPDSRIGQIVNIIADGKHHLVGDKSLIHQIKYQQICHFLHDELRLFYCVSALQHLPGAHAVLLRLICLNLRNGSWLPSPRMIN